MLADMTTDFRHGAQGEPATGADGRLMKHRVGALAIESSTGVVIGASTRSGDNRKRVIVNLAPVTCGATRAARQTSPCRHDATPGGPA